MTSKGKNVVFVSIQRLCQLDGILGGRKFFPVDPATNRGSAYAGSFGQISVFPASSGQLPPQPRLRGFPRLPPVSSMDECLFHSCTSYWTTLQCYDMIHTWKQPLHTMERYRSTNLAAVLKQQGRFQKWLAQQFGVSESFVSKVALGHRNALEPGGAGCATSWGAFFCAL
jgi:hypothetical protein